MEYFILFTMTLVGSLASLSLKHGIRNLNFKTIYVNKYILFGLGLYIFAAILNIYVLGVMPYSQVLPLTSLTYVWTLCFASFFFKEKMSVLKVIGVFFILLGVYLIVL